MRDKKKTRLGAGDIYRIARETYSAVPAALSWSGHAFPPLQYYFEVTRRCNLRCKMCQYLHWLTSTPVSRQSEGELDTSEWCRVIDQIGRFSIITFTGGEPWFRHDFGDLLAYASKRHRVHFISNGTLIDDARARFSVDLAPRNVGGVGLFFIGVSLDGPPEIHDSIRGAGAFDKSSSGIRRLTALRAEAGKNCPLVHVTTVIQENNFQALPQMPEIVRGLGADILNLTLESHSQGVMIDGEYNSGVGSAVDLPCISPEALREVLRATRAAADRFGIELRLPRMPDEEIINYYHGGSRLESFKCQMVWTSIFIDSTGNVSPCYAPVIGNVRELSLRKMYNNPEARAFRRQCRSGLSPLCQGCCELVYKG